jgi:nitrogen regulatory protein P-II 1
MVRITCFVRPHKLEEVKSAIAHVGVGGMSVSDVRGRGNSPESAPILGGEGVVVALPMRSKVVVVVPTEQSEAIVQAIIAAARTGEPGDGKVFVEPVEDALRVRTGERGTLAL